LNRLCGILTTRTDRGSMFSIGHRARVTLGRVVEVGVVLLVATGTAGYPALLAVWMKTRRAQTWCLTLPAVTPLSSGPESFQAAGYVGLTA